MSGSWQVLVSQVSIDPSSADLGSHAWHSGPFSDLYVTVTNDNPNIVWPDAGTYQFSCSGGSSIIINSVQPSSFSLSYQDQVGVSISYSTTSATGQFQIQCQVVMTNPPYGDQASGSYAVTVAAGVPYQDSVTPHAFRTDTRIAGGAYSEVFTVKNTGLYTDTLAIVCLTAGPVTCTGTSATSVILAGQGGSANVTAYYNASAAGTGVLELGAGAHGAADTGTYVIPVVDVTLSLPYNGNLSRAMDGVTYTHETPAVGSMGVMKALSLVYNSSAARPTVLVSLDVTGPSSPAPSAYQLQVQRTDNSAYLSLMNGSTSVYYTAAPGIVDRLTAAIDARANGLATGSYPVNLVLTTTYSGTSRTKTVPTRILVNDQTASPLGVGVGLTGVGRLYLVGSFGRLLVDGSGATEYFDRTCLTCPFASPAGESGTLVSYKNGTTDTLFRLTAVDGSFSDFNAQGYLIRHNVLPSIQDETVTWNGSNLLQTVTDASGRGFTFNYVGNVLTGITDFAGRTTSTSIVNGRLRAVTDPDGGVDSLYYYRSDSLLTQVKSRTGGIWNYSYNALVQGDTILGPSATDYTGASVRPRTTILTPAEVQWQASTLGTTAGTAKSSVRPDTVYLITTDPLGRVSKAQIDRFGQPITIVDVLGRQTTIARDTLGNVTYMRDTTGHAMTATYSGYVLTASYDSSTGQSLTYRYGWTTANQGAAAGWNDPDGVADGTNTISLNAIDDRTVAVGNQLYNTLGDPTVGSNLPASDSNYTVTFRLTASTPTVTPGNNSTITAYLTTSYSTNSGVSWAPVGGTVGQVSASLSTPGVKSTTQVFTVTLHFPSGGPVWIRLALRGTASGTLSGGQVTVQINANTGWYPVAWCNCSASTPARLVAIRGAAVWLDYFYHDGSQGPSGTLKSVYAGNTAPPGGGPAGGTVVAWHYPNANGQDTLVIDGMGHANRWTYAAAASGGNLIQTKDPLGHATTFHYNAYGLPDTTTLANGVKQAASYDALGRDTAATNGLGYSTRFSYDPTGLTRVKDPKGQVYKVDLNAWGLVVAQYDLGDTTKFESVKYDSAGQPRKVVTRRNDTITLTYDSLGRPRTRTGPDFPAESRSYGLLPNGSSWSVASNTNGRDSLVYDKARRLVYAAQTFPGDPTTYSMAYTYDASGLLRSRAAPPQGTAARWVYRPSLGVLDTMCAVGTCAAVARDTELKPITITYNASAANPWSRMLSYDSLHHVTGDVSSSSLSSAWTYDSLGHVSNELTQPGAAYPKEVYSYDAAGELINACNMQSSVSSCVNEYNQSSVAAYQYDAGGNRIDTTAYKGSPSFPGNRIPQFKGYALYYDANGNDTLKAGLGNVPGWTSSTDTTRFQWNAVGQLTRVEKWPAGGVHKVWKFRYDALGRRVGKTDSSSTSVTTWFLYDRDHVEMDLDSATHTMKVEYAFTETGELFALRTPTDTAVVVSTATNHTVLGLSRARGGAVLKTFPDRVGTSPLFPWGQEPADTGFIVRYRMAGQEYDQETGLYHMGARYYDPMLGRWLSEDPAGIAGGLNLYSYVGNDPVNGRDPTGTFDCVGVEDPNGGHWDCHLYPQDCQDIGEDFDSEQCWDYYASGFCAGLGYGFDPVGFNCIVPGGDPGVPGGGQNPASPPPPQTASPVRVVPPTGVPPRHQNLFHPPLPSCRTAVFPGSTGAIEIQTSPQGYVQWGVYMYLMVLNFGKWWVDEYVNGKMINEMPMKLYNPHGSRPPEEVPSGSVFSLTVEHVDIFGIHHFSMPNACVVP